MEKDNCAPLFNKTKLISIGIPLLLATSLSACSGTSSNEIPVTNTSPTTSGTTSHETMGQSNAAKKGKSYLDLMAFSRSGLITQLEYDGFTSEQASYGATANGY